MPTTVVVTEETVLDTIARAGKPIPTTDIVEALGGHKVTDFPMGRLRRVLDNLDETDRVVSAGGPKRPMLPGWAEYQADTREVLWASPETAAKIEVAHKAITRKQRNAIEQRAAMLRAIHKAASPEDRDVLGMKGLLRNLAADPCYRDPDGGITHLAFEELEALCRMLKVEV